MFKIHTSNKHKVLLVESILHVFGFRRRPIVDLFCVSFIVGEQKNGQRSIRRRANKEIA